MVSRFSFFIGCWITYTSIQVSSCSVWSFVWKVRIWQACQVCANYDFCFMSDDKKVLKLWTCWNNKFCSRPVRRQWWNKEQATLWFKNLHLFYCLIFLLCLFVLVLTKVFEPKCCLVLVLSLGTYKICCSSIFATPSGSHPFFLPNYKHYLRFMRQYSLPMMNVN